MNKEENELNKTIRYIFLSEWVESASKEEIISKLIENDERAKALLDIKEYIEEHTDKLKTTRVPKIDFNYKELYDLVNKALGDKENE